jgi:preprotein translocase subunit SecF
MEFFKIKKDIPFMSYGRYTTTISLVTFLLAVFFLATKGLNFGVDFTGGTVMEVHYAQPADVNKVREQLAGIALKDALVQNFGSSHDVLIQVPLKQNTSGRSSEHVMDSCASRMPAWELRRVNSSGRRSARIWWRTARWRCCWCPWASSAISGCVSSGNSAWRRSSPTCMT